LKTDVLIIGAGGAGLTSALTAHENGATIKIITKEYPTRAQTSMAQGGINAVLEDNNGDSIQSHIQNTLKSAHGLGDEEAINLLCTKAPDAIQWLDSIGVSFSRTQDKKIAQRRLGGASAPRACYAQDYTGLKVLHTLYDKTIQKNIEILNERYLLEILTQNNSTYGVKVLNIRSGEIEEHYAKSVIIATGGYSRVYDKHTTNSSASTGDGIAVALKAGALVSDMEFIQFHPTALKNSSILISESARGAGGYILNSKGERFTDELLPRDEVARAIHNEMLQGEDIFLDIRHLGEEFIDKELPQERKLAKLYENIDPVYDLIPIKPVAHYTMGGIDVDRYSATNIKGLYAVGECANQKVHGANRLGGNSLLELIVFGKEAGKNSALYARTINYFKQEESLSNELNINKQPTIDFYKIKEEVGDIFYKDVSIIRDKKSLQLTLDKIEKFIQDSENMGITDNSKIYNTNLIEFLEFKNMLTISKFILLGAINRDESRGAHFRSDAPTQNKLFDKHIIIDKNGEVQ